jgi:hypothetical protein
MAAGFSAADLVEPAAECWFGESAVWVGAVLRPQSCRITEHTKARMQGWSQEVQD